MRIVRFTAVAALVAGLLSLGPTGAQEGKVARAAKKSYEIPYKLTIPKHIVVRVKFNGKGPFNFILDTGAPALFIATSVGKKAGLKADATGWGTIDKMEIEGGLVIEKARGRIETPFQLEGMNGMGLAGVEIHGLMGYQLLAKYRMEIDFTRDKMTWTELNYTPPQPMNRGKGGGNAGGLEMFGSIMKTIGSALGRKANPDITLRGFYGMTLVEGDESPKVEAVLEKGPAGLAGLLPGDIITRVQGRTVTNIADVLTRAKRASTGNKVKLTVKRGDDTRELTLEPAEGI